LQWLLIVLSYPTRGNRARVALHAYLRTTEVDVPFRLRFRFELVALVTDQVRAIIAYKRLRHLDRMAVRADRGAGRVQAAKTGYITFARDPPYARIGIKPRQIVPSCRDRAVDFVYPRGGVVVAAAAHRAIARATISRAQPDKSKRVSLVVQVQQLVIVPYPEEQLEQVRTGSNQLAWIGSPDRVGVTVFIENRLTRTAWEVVPNAVDREVRRQAGRVGRIWRVRVGHNCPLIGHNPLAVIDMLDHVDVTVVSGIVRTALAQQRQRTVDARLEFDRVIPEGVVLDGGSVHPDGRALEPFAATRVLQEYLPLEATMLVRVFHR